MASYTGPCSGDCAPSGWRQTATLTTSALSAPSCPGGSGTGVSSPGTFDCEFFTDLDGTGCFKLTVVSATGTCSCIDSTQQIILYPVTTGVWQSLDTFNLCTGCGLVRLDLTDPCCFPKLTIVGAVGSGFTGPSGSLCGTGTDLVMRHVACGTDTAGRPYADFSSGSAAACSPYQLTTDCSSCPAGTYTKYKFSLRYIGGGCQTGVGVLEYAGGCTWYGNLRPYGVGFPVAVTMVVSGAPGSAVATVTFGTGLTYSGTWDCTAAQVSLDLFATGSCADAQPTLILCAAPSNSCVSDTFRVRITCVPCTVPSDYCCPPDGLPSSLKLFFSVASGVDFGLGGRYTLNYVQNYSAPLNPSETNFTGWFAQTTAGCQADETACDVQIFMNCVGPSAPSTMEIRVYTYDCNPSASPTGYLWVAKGGIAITNCDPVYGNGGLIGAFAPDIEAVTFCFASPLTATYNVAMGDGAECPATPPAGVQVTCTADKAPGTYATGTTINFTCTPSGGTAPYTYYWIFSCLNGTDTVQNPSKTFTLPCGGGGVGQQTYVVVTDAQGNEAYCSVGPFKFV